jgi:hypothetical protein
VLADRLAEGAAHRCTDTSTLRCTTTTLHVPLSSPTPTCNTTKWALESPSVRWHLLLGSEVSKEDRPQIDPFRTKNVD